MPPFYSCLEQYEYGCKVGYSLDTVACAIESIGVTSLIDNPNQAGTERLRREKVVQYCAYRLGNISRRGPRVGLISEFRIVGNKIIGYTDKVV